MPSVATYPHITKVSGEPARLARFSRIRVAQIAMDYLAHGWSAEEICRQYPHLTPSEVHSALAYYFDFREEIDAEIRAEWKETERSAAEQSHSPFVVQLRAKGL